MKFMTAVAVLFLAACSKDDLPEFNRLEGLRILALQTPTPEVSPGATVTLTPIISDVHATSLTYSASACLDLGLSYGASPTCEGNPSKVILANGSALTRPGASESWTGLADSFNVIVPSDTVVFAGRSPSETYNGVNYLIEYSLTNNLGQTIASIKRIVVSESSKTTKNANPVTGQVFANGAPMNSLPYGAKVYLSTDLSLTSAENYIAKDGQGVSMAQTEQLTTTWFVTDGATKYERSGGTDANEFDAPSSAPSGRAFYLLALTRDDRGGVSLVKKKF